MATLPQRPPQKISIETFTEVKKILSDNRPREVEEYAGPDQACPTVDQHDRMHAPHDGWTDHGGRVYAGGQYIAEEDGAQFVNWCSIRLIVEGHKEPNQHLMINKASRSLVFKALYAAKQKVLAETSSRIGEIKERSEHHDLEILQVYFEEGMYGDLYTHIMLSPKGDVFNWRTSRRIGVKGETVSLLGTVKSHYTSKYDVEVTVLTRCKVL